MADTFFSDHPEVVRYILQHEKVKADMTFNHEQAIKDYQHFMRLVSVGAYEERSSYHYERGTWPEDGVEESLFNLEELAARDGLEFFGNEQSGYRLAPMSEETREARARAQASQDDEPEDLVVEMHRRIESPGYNELGEDEPLYHFPDDDEDEDVYEQNDEGEWREYRDEGTGA